MTRRLASPSARKLLARALQAFTVALIVGVAGFAYRSEVLRPIDDGLAQLRFRLLQRPASRTLTVVEIDVPSLRAAGAWPWDRARFARAIDNLNAAGADLVALDVDFSARSSSSADRALDASIRRRPGQVVLPTFLQAVENGGVRRLIGTNPLADLSDEAILASVNVPVDTDGRVRRYRYGFGEREGARPSVAATLAGAPPGREDSFLIDYGIRASGIDRLSFEAVYAGRFDPALVRGRKILIGATALELSDQMVTPNGGAMPGVYVHALAYETLSAGRAMRRLQIPVLLIVATMAAYYLRPRRALAFSDLLGRYALVTGLAILAPLAAQAVLPVSIDSSPLLLTQLLCLVWVIRAELQRRAQAVVEARRAHLLQLAMHMRKSRARIRAANAKLQEANAALDAALKARTEFLATTSHEIRTPLNGILGMTQVILAERKLSKELRAKVDLVHGAGETMLALVDDILDMTRIETGNLVISPIEMDLHKLLEDTARLWIERARSKQLKLKVDYQGGPDWIVEDPTRLRQIVFNLMSNAIKFTEQGQVALRASVEADEDRELLVLEVADSGIGVPADKLDEIFESFRQVDGGITRKYGGSGLGLAICRRLAAAMGGELTVRSVLGEGSVFTLRLPLRRVTRREKATDVGVSPRERTPGAPSILLVEANPLARSMLTAALSDHMSAIDAVASLGEALAALRASGFDLILAEGRALAESAAGAPAALARLAGRAGGARIVVLWSAAPETIASLLAAGAAHVARKPISTGELVRVLAAVCAAGPRPLDAAGSAGRNV